MLSLLLALTLAPAGNASWRTDPVWYDGQAEVALYAAEREIYGEVRHYRASVYTNKESVDPRTSCKSEDGKGVEVFKHHWRERIPTQNYDYDYSTMSYSLAADLAPFKLTMSSHEDCGASLKEFWRDEDGRMLWDTSNYFPGGGNRNGRLGAAKNLALEDALTLSLRDYDFDIPPSSRSRSCRSNASTSPCRSIRSRRTSSTRAGTGSSCRSASSRPTSWASTRATGQCLALLDSRRGRATLAARARAVGAPAQKIRCQLAAQTRKAY